MQPMRQLQNVLGYPDGSIDAAGAFFIGTAHRRMSPQTRLREELPTLAPRAQSAACTGNTRHRVVIGMLPGKHSVGFSMMAA